MQGTENENVHNLLKAPKYITVSIFQSVKRDIICLFLSDNIGRHTQFCKDNDIYMGGLQKQKDLQENVGV